MLVIEGGTMGGKKYEDFDFLPVKQSLYTSDQHIPSYDEAMAAQIMWCRPNIMSTAPEYFNSVIPAVPYCVVQGSLPDDIFLGALMALSAYPKYDLIQNIFASTPDDFRTYGVYTCRFYVEGEWVEIITDTNIPVTRNNAEGTFTPVYAYSPNCNEFWVTLAEKAYAKAVGSYEAIQRVRVHEALLHLTGGSVQQISLADDVANEGEDSVWRRLLHIDDALLLCQLRVKAETTGATTTTAGETKDAEGEEAHAGAAADAPQAAIAESKDSEQAPQPSGEASIHSFQHGKLYSIIALREFSPSRRLVLLHDPWSAPGSTSWHGAWNAASAEWDDAPEIIEAIRLDPSIPWTRNRPGGYLWMSFDTFATFFNSTYICKLFPNEKFAYYCLHGNWKGRESGGPLTYIKDKASVAAAAAESRVHSALKSTAAVVVDGDSSWFNNPQFRIQTAEKAVVYISLVPLTMEGPDGQQVVSLSVTATPKAGGVTTGRLWEGAVTEVIAQDSQGKVRGQEVSIWALHLDPKYVYHVVAETLRLGQEGSFLARIYSMDPLTVERVEGIQTTILSGDWRLSGDLDSRGGPLQITSTDPAAPGVTENSKWCQNPQFHLVIENPYAKDDIHLKIVLRRTDKPLLAQDKSHRGSLAGDKNEVCVGLVVCKADSLEDLAPQKKKGGGPRQNAMGEVGQHSLI